MDKMNGAEKDTVKPYQYLIKVKLLFAYVLFLIGPGLLTYGSWRLYVGIRSRRWPVVLGQITATSIDWKYVGKGGRECLPVIEYQAEYAGECIRGTGDIFTIGSQESAQVILDKYPVGTSVAILVNPRNTCQSCLQAEARVSPESWVFIVLGILLTIADFFCMPYLREALQWASAR